MLVTKHDSRPKTGKFLINFNFTTAESVVALKRVAAFVTARQRSRAKVKVSIIFKTISEELTKGEGAVNHIGRYIT